MKLGDFDAIQVVGALVDGDRGFCYRPVLVEGNRTDFLLYQFPVSAAQTQLYFPGVSTIWQVSVPTVGNPVTNILFSSLLSKFRN